MTRHLDDMRQYIRLTESAPSLSTVTDDSVLNNLDENLILENEVLLLEDVNDMIFKLRSYSERDGSEDYIQGVEEGLMLAASMLERLVERYSVLSRK